MYVLKKIVIKNHNIQFNHIKKIKSVNHYLKSLKLMFIFYSKKKSKQTVLFLDFKALCIPHDSLP